MPLDNSLNTYIYFSLSLHHAISSHLNDDNPRNFPMQTTLIIVEGIRKFYGTEGNVPSSRTVVQDYDLTICVLGVVYAYRGRMVPSLSNRNGHRNHTAGRHIAGWDGFRVNIFLVEKVGWWLHDDTLDEK